MFGVVSRLEGVCLSVACKLALEWVTKRVWVGSRASAYVNMCVLVYVWGGEYGCAYEYE